MPWDLKIDPISGDLVRSSGGWERTEHGDTAVLNQLTIHWERWGPDPDIGSRLFERDLFGADPAGLVGAEVRRALQLLVDEALIADLRVTVAEASPGRVYVRTLYRLVATGQDVEQLLPLLPGA